MIFFFVVLVALGCFVSYVIAPSRGFKLFSYNRLLSYIVRRLFAFREAILKLNRPSLAIIPYNFIKYLYLQ